MDRKIINPYHPNTLAKLQEAERKARADKAYGDAARLFVIAAAILGVVLVIYSSVPKCTS